MYTYDIIYIHTTGSINIFFQQLWKQIVYSDWTGLVLT